jgi:Carboxypeptidase regulatory-like domain
MTNDPSRPAASPASSNAQASPGTPASVAAAVTGDVFDAAGRPVPGALVTAVSLDTPGSPVPEIAVLTDRGGHYRWPAVLAAGRYRLEVRTANGTGTSEVTVHSGTTASADLTLRR